MTSRIPFLRPDLVPLKAREAQARNLDASHLCPDGGRPCRKVPMIITSAAVTPAARSFGMTTAWAPAQAALRMRAPRLWGSCTESRTRMSPSPVPCNDSMTSASSA